MWSEGIPIVHPNKYEQKLQPIVLQDLAKGVFQAMSDPNSIGSTYDFGGDRVFAVFFFFKLYCFIGYYQFFFFFSLRGQACDT